MSFIKLIFVQGHLAKKWLYLFYISYEYLNAFHIFAGRDSEDGVFYHASEGLYQGGETGYDIGKTVVPIPVVREVAGATVGTVAAAVGAVVGGLYGFAKKVSKI